MALAECLEPVRQELSSRQPDVLFIRSPQAKVLRRGLAAIVLAALRESDALLKPLLTAGGKAEFAARRKKIFKDYVNLSYVVANSFSGAEAEERALATKEAFKLVEHIIHEQGTPRLGTERVRETIFCLNTLRRAARLVGELHSLGDLPAERKEKDEELAISFNASVLWAQFHLDCIRIFVKKSVDGIEQDVLDEMVGGARMAVMAYSYVRQGVELRTEQEPYLLEGGPLDTEDKELLEESYSDYTESESGLDAQTYHSTNIFAVISSRAYQFGGR
jgi:hypothetical protein